MVFSRLRSSTKPKPALALVQQTDAGDNRSICLQLDLLPIPAAMIALEGGALSFESVNQLFREAGLGTTAQKSPLVEALGEPIRKFIGGDALRDSLAWELGKAVDCRYFRVTFARPDGPAARQQCLITLVDLTGAHRTERSLRREMNTDSLTGLPNRAGFGDLIETALAAEQRGEFGVLAVNLDRFSRINACMGSISGDELLISVARRLRGVLRGHDVLARTGGDEFAILMRLDEGLEDAMRVAQRIHAALATPFRLSDFEIRIDCAIGIAFRSERMSSVEDLIRHAQFAVNRAKQTGETEVYERESFVVAREQFSVETELRRAIETGRMELHFQPICDLSTGRITSFESLARWRTEAGQALSPTTFIPVAEESGLIVPLGRWAIEQAAETLAAWDRAAGGHCGIRLAVNLSAIQLQRDDVPTHLNRTLEQHGLNGDRLTLELTESAIVSDPDRIARLMHVLKESGATLAMDDFGTGYSNLAYLQRLPIDILKIDRSFVAGMMGDRDKIAIVRAILSLAQALGKKTTAEGIESNELAQTLAALGCTYGQGFLYGRPLAADAAYELLLQRNA